MMACTLLPPTKESLNPSQTNIDSRGTHRHLLLVEMQNLRSFSTPEHGEMLPIAFTTAQPVQHFFQVLCPRIPWRSSDWVRPRTSCPQANALLTKLREQPLRMVQTAGRFLRSESIVRGEGSACPQDKCTSRTDSSNPMV